MLKQNSMVEVSIKAQQKLMKNYYVIAEASAAYII
jgi:hypothetical protein